MYLRLARWGLPEEDDDVGVEEIFEAVLGQEAEEVVSVFLLVFLEKDLELLVLLVQDDVSHLVQHVELEGPDIADVDHLFCSH